MPLPLPNLDDRRFDDLVAEAQERLVRQLPDLAQISPGDPVFALVDLFAWMTETILYRANLIPERQRRVLLNLLQLPLRPANPAHTLVCVDASPEVNLPDLLLAESRFSAGDVSFSSVGELQPLPLIMDIMIKETINDEQLKQANLSLEALKTQYGVAAVRTFRPRHLLANSVDSSGLSLANSLDHAFYLLFSVPTKLQNKKEELRQNLAGMILNIALAPASNKLADEFPAHESVDDRGRLPPRLLKWDLAWENEGKLYYIPLEVVDDSSRGGRQMGITRLRLSDNTNLLRVPRQDAPQFAGTKSYPPEQPVSVKEEQMLFWIRLSCDDEPQITLGYLGVNGVEVIGQNIVRNQKLGRGTGRSNQTYPLPHSDIESASLKIEVEEVGLYQIWRQVDYFSPNTVNEPVYTFDSSTGLVRFGDGIQGKRPLSGRVIRAAYYRHGGGKQGNLPAASITRLVSGSRKLKVRHEWHASGGVDAESIIEAEQRIPSWLTHRNRAVSKEDFVILAETNPMNPVARAECRPGMFPGSQLSSLEVDRPGVVSVFVMPPVQPALGTAPRPTKGLLADTYAYLSDRTTLGTELYVLSPEFVPIALSMTVESRDKKTTQTTLAAVKHNMLVYLWGLSPGGSQGEGWLLGQTIDIDELKTQAGRTQGVLSIKEAKLFYQVEKEKGTKSWQAHKGKHFQLADYQLPMLMAMQTQTNGEPHLPEGLTEVDDNTVVEIPVPVVPDSC